jgi:tRNA nucleotidyltransferase (CCA-adding enzyme)
MEVLRTLSAAGHRSWIVGGVVRDLLLRRPRGTTDQDVATPARPDEVAALFRKVVPTGVEHGTVTVVVGGAPVEVTTFRGEGAYEDGRRPSSVTFLGDIDQDLARRDFTINALAYDPLAKEFRDPFGGRGDLRRRLLRAVGDPSARFSEDGLRPLRAARFAAQLGFELEPGTAAAIPGALPVVARVSVERVADELSRLVLAPHALRGLLLLEATGLLSVVLPELAAAGPEERAHAYRTLTAAPAELELRAAALLHVLAPSEGEAARRARGVLERMRFSGRVREGAASLVFERRCLAAAAESPLPAGEVEVRRFLARVGPARVRKVLALWEADARAIRPPGRARRERAALAAFRRLVARVERGRPPISASDLAVDGAAVMRVLGIPPGPSVGEALRHLLERVLERPALNTAEELTSELKVWWAARTSS